MPRDPQELVEFIVAKHRSTLQSNQERRSRPEPERPEAQRKYGGGGGARTATTGQSSAW